MTRFQVVPAAYVYLLSDVDAAPHVLLQLRRNTGYRDGFWAAGAAGHVEAGESVVAAARREAREELGIEPLDLTPLTSLHRTDGSDDPVEQRVDWFFTCRSWTGEPQVRELHKVADLQWHPLHELPRNIVPHERVVLDALAAGPVAPILALGFDEPTLGLDDPLR